MSTRQVTGTYLDGSATPLAGRLFFRPVTRVVTGDAIVLPERVSVDLDEDGQFEVELQDTDTGEPDGWVWEVTERFAAGASTWLFDLPASVDPLDLADASPISPAPGEWQYRGPQGVQGPAGPTGPMGSWC